MKILPLIFGLSNANNIYKFCDIHRETVSVGRQATTIASPEFPDSFPVQTQCKWIIKSQGGENIKIQFDQWAVPASPEGGCRVMFVSILDSGSSDLVTSDTAKKGVNFCGLNPGTYISSSSSIELIIHSDSHPSGSEPLRFFQAKVSSTNQAPTPVVPGKRYSQGAVDNRFAPPAPRQVAPAMPAMAGQPAGMMPMARPYAPQRPMPGQMPMGGHHMGGHHMAQQPPVFLKNGMASGMTAGGMAPGSERAFERPTYEIPFTRAPELFPASGPGSQRTAPRRVNPLAGIIPKNHAKKPGATREDVHGRVNTKLIARMQQLKKSGTLNQVLSGMKAPEAPTGPGVLAPGALPPAGAPHYPRPNPQAAHPGAVYSQNGQIVPGPAVLKHSADMPEQAMPVTVPPQEAEDNENMNLVIMIGIGTGVITLVSIVIVLLFYIHKRVKKQEFQEHQITTQKYMFDHTVLSRGSTLAAGESRKEPVDKPRDFMDEDDVEMVRAVCRAPSERRPTTSNAGFSSRSSESSKDSGIDGSCKAKSYTTSLKS